MPFLPRRRRRRRNRLSVLELFLCLFGGGCIRAPKIPSIRTQIKVSFEGGLGALPAASELDLGAA